MNLLSLENKFIQLALPLADWADLPGAIDIKYKIKNSVAALKASPITGMVMYSGGAIVIFFGVVLVIFLLIMLLNNKKD